MNRVAVIANLPTPTQRLKTWTRLVATLPWVEASSVSKALQERKRKGEKDEDYLFVESQYEAAYRKVSRHRASVEKILKNVARGQFP